jgi:D-alanyl-D-alanine carboxypeptidase
LIGFSLFLSCCLFVAAVLLGKAAAPDVFARLPHIPAFSESGAAAEASPLAASENPAEEIKWNLALVNQWNPLGENLPLELTELSNGQLVDERIYPALQEMFDDARSEGIYPEVVSGYRSAEEQRRMMDDKIARYRDEGYSEEEATADAEVWVAAPGTSEHHLGLAVDINADGVNSAGYDVYGWLRENAHKYGFILRYPPDKTDVTGIGYEPWHYRYVGVPAATEIYNRGICLEEYLGGVSQ